MIDLDDLLEWALTAERDDAELEDIAELIEDFVSAIHVLNRVPECPCCVPNGDGHRDGCSFAKLMKKYG